MKPRRQRPWAALRARGTLGALALGLLVIGCAGAKVKAPPRWSVPKPTQQGGRPAAPDPAPAGLAAQKHMAAGAWQAGIEAYDAERQRRPADQALIRQYVKSLEDIKASADQACQRSDFAVAGTRYDVLRKNYPRFRTFAPALSFDEAQLEAKLAHCRQALAARGFERYRQGDLDQAIATWRSLLAIDPSNSEIKTALKTATLQQKNLREGAAGR